MTVQLLFLFTGIIFQNIFSGDNKMLWQEKNYPMS